MVKDVADSKRINASIHSDQNPHHSRHKFPISAMILSSQFWPTFKEQSLQVPEEVVREMEIYTEAYQDLKGNRTLNWKPHLGQVKKILIYRLIMTRFLFFFNIFYIIHMFLFQNLAFIKIWLTLFYFFFYFLYLSFQHLLPPL